MDDTYAWSRVDGASEFRARHALSRRGCRSQEPARGRKGRPRRARGGRSAGRGRSRLVSSGRAFCPALVPAQPRPAVLMSDSALRDERAAAPGSDQGGIVRLFGGALVGGAPHGEYACALGLAPAGVRRLRCRGQRPFRARRPASSERRGAVARTARPAGALFPRLRPLRPQEEPAGPARGLCRLSPARCRRRLASGASGRRRVARRDRAPHRAADLAGAVILPGFRQYDELPAFYGLARAFVHASTTEQWGLVVNEAMAAGLPVLVSDRCGCAQDLVRNGVNGFTFDPCDVEELAGLMHRVAAMPNGSATRWAGPAGRSSPTGGAVRRWPDAGGPRRQRAGCRRRRHGSTRRCCGRSRAGR